MKSLLNLCFLLAVMTACFPLCAKAVFISAVPEDGMAMTDRNRNPLDEDNCPPQTIVSVPLTINGNTSTSGWHFLSSCNGNGPDDIYALSLSCDYQVTVSLCGSGFDTVIEVRHGTNYFDCPGSEFINCNDDFCGFQSQMSFFAAVGEFYFIVVSGYQGATGAYSLQVSGTPLAPNNDACNGARLISNAPYRDFGSTACANNSITPGCASSNAPDVVYRLNMPCNASVTATTCGHPLMDAVLHVYKYGACGNTFVTCNDDAGCPNNQSLVYFQYEAYQDYFIWVDGWSNSSGYYVLHLSAQGNAEDQCGVIILDLPVTLNGTLVCEHDDYPQCFAGTSNDDVFVLQPQDHCRYVTVSMCGSPESFDSVLEIRRGGSECPGAVVVSCTDDGECSGEFSYHSTASFMADANETYYFMVNGYYGSEGAYVMSAVEAPCELAAPESLVVRYDTGTQAAFLYWAPVAGADYYYVYRDSLADVAAIPENYLGLSYSATFEDSDYPPNPCIRHYIVTAVRADAAPEVGSQPGKAVPVQAAAVRDARTLTEGVDYWPVRFDYENKTAGIH